MALSPQAKVGALALSMIMSIFSGVVFYGQNNDDAVTPVVGVKDGMHAHPIDCVCARAFLPVCV